MNCAILIDQRDFFPERDDSETPWYIRYVESFLQFAKKADVQRVILTDGRPAKEPTNRAESSSLVDYLKVRLQIELIIEDKTSNRSFVYPWDHHGAKENQLDVSAKNRKQKIGKVGNS